MTWKKKLKCVGTRIAKRGKVVEIFEDLHEPRQQLGRKSTKTPRPQAKAFWHGRNFRKVK